MVSNKLHKIANLFEINDKCGFFKANLASSADKAENRSNLCLSQTFNRFYHFMLNIKHLESLMMDEFASVIKQDLNIGDDESEGSQEKEGNHHEEKALLKEFGINTDVFDQTISMFTETSSIF